MVRVFALCCGVCTYDRMVTLMLQKLSSGCISLSMFNFRTRRVMEICMAICLYSPNTRKQAVKCQSEYRTHTHMLRVQSSLSHVVPLFTQAYTRKWELVQHPWQREDWVEKFNSGSGIPCSSNRPSLNHWLIGHLQLSLSLLLLWWIDELLLMWFAS